MGKHTQLSGNGISVKLVALNGERATLEVCVTKDGESLVFWAVEHLDKGDTWNLSGCDIKVPIEVI